MENYINWHKSCIPMKKRIYKRLLMLMVLSSLAAILLFTGCAPVNKKTDIYAKSASQEPVHAPVSQEEVRAAQIAAEQKPADIPVRPEKTKEEQLAAEQGLASAPKK